MGRHLLVRVVNHDVLLIRLVGVVIHRDLDEVRRVLQIFPWLALLVSWDRPVVGVIPVVILLEEELPKGLPQKPVIRLVFKLK